VIQQDKDCFLTGSKMNANRINKSLWFVAVIPPDPIRSEVWDMKLEMRSKYHSKKSLSSPPHITLVAPFKIAQQYIGKVERIIREQIQGVRSFYTELNGFSAFAPRVLFVRPVKNKSLDLIWRKLNESLDSILPIDKRNKFNPHMTIATRDLTRDNYQKAADYFLLKRYERMFLVDKIYLLKHNGQRWDIYGEYKLRKQ
jgi:2'-5' RNA ligase